MDMDLDCIDCFFEHLGINKEHMETKKKKIITGTLARLRLGPVFVILTPQVIQISFDSGYSI